MREDVLSKIYTQSLGIEKYLEEVARIVEQISHRHPHLNVLEIGKFPSVVQLFAMLILIYRRRGWGNIRTSHAGHGIGFRIIYVL